MRWAVTLIVILSVACFSLDLTFFNIDIKDALTQLSMMSNIPIVFPSTITGTVNLEIYDISLETALNILLSGTDYDWIKRDDYYLIGGISDKERLIVGTPRTIVLKNTTAEQIKPFLKNYQDYIVSAEGCQIVILSGERIYKEITQIVETLDVITVSKLLWYRYVRLTQEEKSILVKLKSSNVFSFEENTFNVVSQKEQIVIDDVIKVVSKKDDSRICSGVIPITQGKETKVDISNSDDKFEVTFLYSANNIGVVLKDQKTNVETTIAYEPGKAMVVILDDGLFEICMGEVLPVTVVQKVEKHEKYEVVAELFIKDGYEFLVGASVNVVGNLKFSILGGMRNEKIVGCVKLKDYKQITENFASYGDFAVTINKDFDISTRFSIGIGFSFDTIFLGGGLWTDLEEFYPELGFMVKDRNFGLYLSYIFGCLPYGLYTIGFWVRW